MKEGKAVTSPIGNAYKFFCVEPNGTKSTGLVQFKDEWNQLTDKDKKEIDEGIRKQAA